MPGLIYVTKLHIGTSHGDDQTGVGWGGVALAHYPHSLVRIFTRLVHTSIKIDERLKKKAELKKLVDRSKIMGPRDFGTYSIGGPS